MCAFDRKNVQIMRFTSSDSVADEPHEVSTSDGVKSFLSSPAREAIPFDAMKYLLSLMVSVGMWPAAAPGLQAASSLATW